MTPAEMLQELRHLNHRITPVILFLNEHKHEPIAAGALRIWNPPTLCETCGGYNDITGDEHCPCWEPVTPEIADELEIRGIAEIRHKGENQ